MTTARDLIEDAAAEIGVFASDSALSDADAQIMLRRLNRMMDSWSAEGLAVYERYDESLTLSAGVASYSTALLAGGRPVRVDGVTVTVGGVDYDMRMVSKANYDEIGYKSVAGIPDMCYVQMGMPDATLYFYPAPSAAYTAKVTVWRRMPNGMALTTTVSLPPGYEEAIVTNLAVACAPMFGASPQSATVENARESKATIKRNNTQHIEMDLNLPGASSRAGFIDMGPIL